MECSHWLLGAVHISRLLRLDIAILVINCGLDNTITDCLVGV